MQDFSKSALLYLYLFSLNGLRFVSVKTANIYQRLHYLQTFFKIFFVLLYNCTSNFVPVGCVCGKRVANIDVLYVIIVLPVEVSVNVAV